jgi:hypothetical protein
MLKIGTRRSCVLALGGLLGLSISIIDPFKTSPGALVLIAIGSVLVAQRHAGTAAERPLI